MSPSWSRWLACWRSKSSPVKQACRRSRRSTNGLRLECLERRDTPAMFMGGVSVASADVNGDGFRDLITGAGSGGGPHVKVYSGQDGQELLSFFAYDPAFAGGAYVAAGDVDGDGKADIITGPGEGGGPFVQVFSGANGALIRAFAAFDGAFTGGVRVAAGDVSGDGRADIIVGAGPGGAPLIQVFDGATGTLLRGFSAFDGVFDGGVFVAAGDVNGDGRADIIAGAGAGGGPIVQVFNGATGAQHSAFFVFDGNFTGGVQVAAGDVNGDGKADIIAGAGADGGPIVQALDGTTGAELAAFFAFDGKFTGGAFVAASDINGDGKVEFIAGAGTGGSPLVQAFANPSLSPMMSFNAYEPTTPPGGFAQRNDTTPPTVQITTQNPGTTNQNVTIQGRATDDKATATDAGIATVRAQVDNGSVQIISFDTTGNFSFTTSFALDGTANGSHTVSFQAVDRAGNESQKANFTFTLNTSNSALTFDLEGASDTGTKGDQRTEQNPVDLVGQTTANSTVILLKGTATVNTTTADSTGAFRFDNVQLGPEVNDFTVQATDPDGHETSLTRSFFLNTAPTVASPVGTIQVQPGAPDTILNLPGIFNDADVNTQVHFDTTAGGFDLQLFDQQTPKTVANFLAYINSGRYASTFFHRSVENFVIQAGGFKFQPSPATITSITTDPAVVNEPVLSNQAGTIAMAKLGTDANSATSQFFVNLVDNSRGNPKLDTQNSGFTAFGQVLGIGMQVVNQLAAIPTQNRSSFNSSFDTIPLQNYPTPPAGNFPTDTTAANYALVNNVTVVHQPDARNGDALTFELVSNTNPTVVNTALINNNSRLILHYPVGPTGSATITLRATDKNGSQVTTSFTVNVGTPSDTTAPTVTVTSPPSGQTVTSNPNIVGQATDNVAVTQLQAAVDGGTAQTVTLDGQGNFSFTPAVPTDGSANGLHTVIFTARDAAGNMSTPVTFTYTLNATDTTAPTVMITSPPSGQTFATNPTINGHASDDVAVTQVQASVDGGGAQNVTFDSQGNFTFTPATAINGQHTVSFTAMDAAGNLSAPATFTYTLQGP